MLDADVIRDAHQMIDRCVEHTKRAHIEYDRLKRAIADVRTWPPDHPKMSEQLNILDAQLNILQRVFQFE